MSSPSQTRFLTEDDLEIKTDPYRVIEKPAKEIIVPIEPVLSDNALRVLERRYLRKDKEGKIAESPAEMFSRVARHIASADLKYDPDTDVRKTEIRFFNLMASLDFLPNSPTLMNAGRELGQLSACFVLPIEDSMDQIFDTVKNTALIHKSGGGTGFSFSRLRPKNSVVRSTAGTASGPVSFMSVFNSATETVKQGGTRRGANMGVLRMDHPDILEFIGCKHSERDLNNFNISVAVTDEFMEAVKSGGTYWLFDPHTQKRVSRMIAREVFDQIVEQAWQNGEPGIIFLDKVNAHNPTPSLGLIESTNPCGEQPLLPYESCNLGSINLSTMVSNGKLDWDKLEETVCTAVHFLDNVIDLNQYPLPQIREMTFGNRKIGLGVMGFADMLVQLGIHYDSEEGLKTAEGVMEFIHACARKKSDELALKRGPFPNCPDSIFTTPTRNATVTTIAPTGTLSMIAETSGGIEPHFSLVYIKKVMDNEELLYVNRVFEEVARKEGFYNPEMMKRVSARGSLQNIDGIPDRVKEIFRTSHDITPEWHVRMQAAFQKYTDNAVSKTINFPHSATKDDVHQAYLLAYELGCKGLTVYRDGSREEQVLNVGSQIKEGRLANGEKLHPRNRPPITSGITERIRTGEGNLYITINEDDFGLCEVFASIGKAGGNAAAQSEAISRLISLAMRSGINTNEIIEELKGISGPNPVWDLGELILSAPDAIGKALERYLTRMEQMNELDKEDQGERKTSFIEENLEVIPRGDVCPKCNGHMDMIEGCATCRSCGFSKCG